MSAGSDHRSEALWLWFTELCQVHALGSPVAGIRSVSGDASFRRYFRGYTEHGSWILVDAPTDREDSKPFLAVQKLLAKANVQVPAVIASDLHQGFMCLEDLGDELLLYRLEHLQLQMRADSACQRIDALYRMAFDELLKIQSCAPENSGLPAFTPRKLNDEMELFRNWLCQGLLGLELSLDETRIFEAVKSALLESALAEPAVVVHRDYHSRNLMLTEKGLGVIDFQDAVIGPFSYDLVSILKDCYISWPQEKVAGWALQYYSMAGMAGIIEANREEGFMEDFLLMGAQRHLKAAGIFCRLWLRDGKPGYLKEIHRTLTYITREQFRQQELVAFAAWIENRIMPSLQSSVVGILQSLDEEKSVQGSGS